MSFKTIVCSSSIILLSTICGSFTYAIGKDSYELYVNNKKQHKKLTPYNNYGAASGFLLSTILLCTNYNFAVHLTKKLCPFITFHKIIT